MERQQAGGDHARGSKVERGMARTCRGQPIEQTYERPNPDKPGPGGRAEPILTVGAREA